MRIVAAATLADAVTVGFREFGEFAIGRPGPLLDMWLGQHPAECDLSLVVDASTAAETDGVHVVLADLIATTREDGQGIRISLSGRPYATDDGEGPRWIVEASEVHAPALSLSGAVVPHSVVAPSAVDAARAALSDETGAAHDGIASEDVGTFPAVDGIVVSAGGHATGRDILSPGRSVYDVTGATIEPLEQSPAMAAALRRINDKIAATRSPSTPSRHFDVDGFRSRGGDLLHASRLPTRR